LNKSLLFLSLIVIAAAVIGFQTGAYYYFQQLFSPTTSPTHPAGNHNDICSSVVCIEVNTIINYGNYNHTIVWFNHTRVPQSWNFYNVTILITNGRVHSEYYQDLGENQVLGLNGVEQNATSYWSLWKFCPGYNAWALTPVGVDRIALSNNGIYGWYFQSQSGTQYPPVPGAKTVTVLDIRTC
jgi:hypothetical protein